MSALLARLVRLWFQLSTLPIRGRFLTGKASFVEADVRMTSNNVGLGQKLLAHYHLATRQPRSGAQGWRLYDQRAAGRGPHLTVSLQCGWCRHVFIVQVLAALDPLASDETGGKSAGLPASYSAEWFRFLPERYEGEPCLSCPRCEQESRPRVRFLGGP